MEAAGRLHQIHSSALSRALSSRALSSRALSRALSHSRSR